MQYCSVNINNIRLENWQIIRQILLVCLTAELTESIRLTAEHFLQLIFEKKKLNPSPIQKQLYIKVFGEVGPKLALL